MRKRIERTIASAMLVAFQMATIPTFPGAARAEGNRVRFEPGHVLESFDHFSRSWLDKLDAAAVEMFESDASDGPRGFRRIPQGHETEIKATGHSDAPYVGLLRYTEQSYRCGRSDGSGCFLAGETRVTEIFRFQHGVWIY